MPRCGLLLGLLLIACGPPGWAQFPDIATIDKASAKAIASVERSVVGIVVARADAYSAFEPKQPRAPGVLGKFEPAALLANVPETDHATRRRIADLDLASPDHVPEATATGLVLDKAGLILVPAHAVVRAKKLYVKLPDGKGSYADIHALDPRSDLAVLRLLAPPAGLVPATLGDGGTIRAGRFLLLVTNPFVARVRDSGPTASWGIVANVRQKLGTPEDSDRGRQTLHHHGTLLQLDARRDIPTGGGGVVLTFDGAVVGLLTAYPAPQPPETPGGFAMPLDDGLRRIIEVLRKGAEVEYGFLGVSPDKRLQGVGVSGVPKGSPAEQAGLRNGAVLLRIDGQPVADPDDLFLFVGAKLAGTTIQVEYQPGPGAQARTANVTLAKFWTQTPGSIVSRPGPAPAGLRVDWTSVLYQQGKVGRREMIPEGVVIRAVLPGSSADRAKLTPDEVITHVDGTQVRTPAEFYRAMAGAGAVKLTFKDREPVTLTR